MNRLSSPEIFWPALVGLFIVALATVIWLRSRRQSPEEKERLRRLGVHERGRLADGELLDGPELPPEGNLLYYTYRAAGVEYTAAQDVSSLGGFIRPELCRPGNTTSVKYDPRLPANSIIICEEWSGLHNERSGARRHANN